MIRVLLDTVQYVCTRMYYVPVLLSEYQAGPPTLLINIITYISDTVCMYVCMWRKLGKLVEN